MRFEREAIEINERELLSSIIDTIVDEIEGDWGRDLICNYLYDKNISLDDDEELEEKIYSELHDYIYNAISNTLYNSVLK